MKNLSLVICVLVIMACNSQADSGTPDSKNNSNGNATDNSGVNKNTGCNNDLLFAKGAVIHNSSYNEEGKETARQISTVKKVYADAGMTVSEIEMKNTSLENNKETIFNAVYKCDGKQMYVDLSGFMPGSSESKLETSGLLFPFEVSVGETLPDADYSIIMNAAGKTMKITSHIRERKVEANEPVTTAAGTFNCYRVSSLIEADMDMPGMDEDTKKIMEQVKKKMGKNVMTFWYAPGVTILKMEYRTGDKLVTRSEVTAIKR